MNEMRTYQTRLKADTRSAMFLSAYAALFCLVEHKLFACLCAGVVAMKDIKRAFLSEFDITGRQFNAVRVSVEGKIESVREVRKQNIETLIIQIKRAEKVLAKTARRKKTVKVLRKLHEKQRRLFNLKTRLAALENDVKTGKVRLCFGSRKLFRAQFELIRNGYADLAFWKSD